MKRVAIPIDHGTLSEYFGRCSYYKVFEIEGKSVSEMELDLPMVSHIEELPQWAAENGITDIIAYKVDRQIIKLFNKHKINLFVGISKDTPEKLIAGFMNERLVSNNTIIAEIIGNKEAGPSGFR